VERGKNEIRGGIKGDPDWKTNPQKVLRFVATARGWLYQNHTSLRKTKHLKGLGNFRKGGALGGRTRKNGSPYKRRWIFSREYTPGLAESDWSRFHRRRLRRKKKLTGKNGQGALYRKKRKSVRALGSGAVGDVSMTREKAKKGIKKQKSRT